MAVNPCLHHSQKWRSEFQFVINNLQKLAKRSKYGSVNYGSEEAPGEGKATFTMALKDIRRIPSAICTCDIDDDDEGIVITEEAVTEVAELKEFFKKLSPENRTVFGKSLPLILRISEELSPEASGQVLFLKILKEAFEGSCSSLDSKVPIKSNREKSLDWSEEVVELPLHFLRIGLLIGKGGVHVKKMRADFHCQIHVKRLPHSDKIFIHLRWKKEHADRIPALKKHLENFVNRINAGRVRHEANVKQFLTLLIEKRTKRLHPSKSSGAGVKNYGKAVTNFKSINEDQFARHKSSRAKSTKKHNEGPKKDVKILDGSHCYYCLGSYKRTKRNSTCSMKSVDDYDDESEDDDNERDEDEPEDNSIIPEKESKEICQYHPGYLARSDPSRGVFVGGSDKRKTYWKWTCCDETIPGPITDKVKHTSHSATGCKHGSHMWRPNRKPLQEKMSKGQRGILDMLEEDICVK